MNNSNYLSVKDNISIPIYYIKIPELKNKSIYEEYKISRNNK